MQRDGKPVNTLLHPEPQHIGAIIRQIRTAKGMTARQLAKCATVDPRTLSAIEKGRIRTPSLEHLSRIARGLKTQLAEIFGLYEARKQGRCISGTSKGNFSITTEEKNFTLISYTPPMQEIFCGKMLLHAKRCLDKSNFDFTALIFIQMIFGRVTAAYLEKKYFLKERMTLLFDGRYDFSLSNDTPRDASFLFFATPSPWGKTFLKFG